MFREDFVIQDFFLFCDFSECFFFLSFFLQHEGLEILRIFIFGNCCLQIFTVFGSTWISLVIKVLVIQLNLNL